MEENTNFDNIDFTWQPSQELIEQIQNIDEVLRQAYDAMVEWVIDFLERVRKIAERLARFFLKQQLLEWRVPYPIADFLSKKLYGDWAWYFGWRWLKNKLLE